MKVTVLIALALAAAVANAGPRDFAVEHAGFGATTQQAQPYLDKFTEYVQTSLGWPEKPKATFFPEPDEAFKKEISEVGFGMIDPDQVLELAKKDGVKPIATVIGKNQSLGHVHLIVKNPAIKGLDDLKGKTLVGAHLQSERYVFHVMLEKPQYKSGDVKLSPVASMLKAVKQVDRDEADAALLSDEEVDALKGMTFAALHEVWKSGALPPMSVVATKHAKPADREAVAKMLLAMCSDAKGVEVCKALDVTKFAPPDTAAYDAAAKKMAK
jgi:ABC-type phosphate/phosphonate transport system substrate-binding protein